MQKNKINIAVLMGGQSAEREVSLRTGKKIAQTLDRKKYNVNLIEISAKGQWLLKEKLKEIKTRSAVGREPALKLKQSNSLALKETNSQSLSPQFQRNHKKLDLVFIALHGPKGEDGTVQGMLELLGLPYTGSGVLASALGMDKKKSAEVFEFNGLKMPKNKIIEADSVEQMMRQIKKLPIVIKPNNLGSSVGVFIVENKAELKSALQKVVKCGDKILIEEYLQGVEVSCGVLENFKDKKYFALPPIEIVPRKKFKFFNYAAKYTPGATEEICPARLNTKLIKAIQKTAITAHKALNCRHYSRTDMIIKNNKIYVLELNTLPGMTETSLLPQEAKVAGLEFNDLVEPIVKLALRK